MGRVLDQRAQPGVLNLLKNAIEALGSRSGGRIEVSAKPDGDEVVIVISDNGPGVPDKVRGTLFDPFVTTKRAGNGAGLGLSVCRRGLAELDGKIALLDSEFGAAFEIRLPVIGDWNDDGVFDQYDIVAALQTGNYLQGSYAACAADGVFAAIGS